MNQQPTRRDLLRHAGSGFGYLALAGLSNAATAKERTIKSEHARQRPLAAREPHFPARAKRVIFLFMQGGPSHVDMFDYKPELQKLAGKTTEEGSEKESKKKKQKGKNSQGRLMASPWKFSPHGESGLMISELFPHLSKHADNLCLINGMHTDNPAHPQATVMWHTGSINFVRPSIGSWVVYGLGSENQDLPGFVTINPNGNLGGAQNFGSAFLPASYQGTSVQSGPNPIANIRGSKNRRQQRKHLDLIQSLNQGFLKEAGEHSELEGVIASYELAFRMQSSVPEIMDINSEPESVKEKYGINEKQTSDFGMQCLMARRLSEAGVRFVELTYRGWDQHNSLKTKLPANCTATDKPIAALMDDLKERGMLDDTLIVWSGEFGRTPTEQNNFDGRRHNNRGFTTWLAGGGTKGGLRYGETDPTGYEAVQNKVHTHDLHATILHLLGLNHEKLTYRYSGRDFRLTDVYGNVIQEIIA